jgi:hypothetical protein
MRSHARMWGLRERGIAFNMVRWIERIILPDGSVSEVFCDGVDPDSLVRRVIVLGDQIDRAERGEVPMSAEQLESLRREFVELRDRYNRERRQNWS